MEESFRIHKKVIIMDIKKVKERTEKEINELEFSNKDKLKLNYLRQELKWCNDLEKDSGYEK